MMLWFCFHLFAVMFMAKLMHAYFWSTVHLKRGNLAVRHIELVAILKGLHSQKIYKMQHTVSHLSALNPDSQRGRHGRFRRRQLTDLFFFYKCIFWSALSYKYFWLHKCYFYNYVKLEVKGVCSFYLHKRVV